MPRSEGGKKASLIVLLLLTSNLVSPQAPLAEEECTRALQLLDMQFFPRDYGEDATTSVTPLSQPPPSPSSSPSSSPPSPPPQPPPSPQPPWSLTCRDKSGYSDIISFRRRAVNLCHVYLFRGEFKGHFKLKAIDEQRLLLVQLNERATTPSSHVSVNNTDTENKTSVSGGSTNKHLYESHTATKDVVSGGSELGRVLDALTERDFMEICEDLMSDDCSRWKECIASSLDCCKRQLHGVCKQKTAASTPSPHPPMCPSVWDGFSCWQAADAGVQLVQKCPRYIKPTRLSATSIKKCREDGVWFKKSNAEWSDYTGCYDHSAHVTAVYIVISINVISIFFLLAAILVYVYFRDLIRQDRVILHVNFFLSLLLSSLSHLLWTCLVYLNKLRTPNDAFSVAHRNPVWCRMINFMCVYFGGTTYTWMFCEGFHLHRLISNAFVVPKSMAVLYCIGWVFPMITALLYAIVRYFVDNERCWIKQDGHYSWIIYTPNTICIALNLIFLLNILRILFFQLQNQPNEPNSFRRGLKAGLMLVPLFGLQMAATAYRPDLEGEAEVFIQVVFDVLIHSQGIFVSLIFCFLSGEVLNQLRRESSNRCCKGWNGRSHLTTFTNTVNSMDCVNDANYDDVDKGNKGSHKNKKNSRRASKPIFKSSETMQSSKESFDSKKNSSNITPLIEEGKEGGVGTQRLNAEFLEMETLNSKKE